MEGSLLNNLVGQLRPRGQGLSHEVIQRSSYLSGDLEGFKKDGKE